MKIQTRFYAFDTQHITAISGIYQENTGWSVFEVWMTNMPKAFKLEEREPEEAEKLREKVINAWQGSEIIIEIK